MSGPTGAEKERREAAEAAGNLESQVSPLSRENFLVRPRVAPAARVEILAAENRAPVVRAAVVAAETAAPAALPLGEVLFRFDRSRYRLIVAAGNRVARLAVNA